MPTIIVKNQAEIDALPASFEVFTTIEIRGGEKYSPLQFTKNPESSHVVARGSSHVVARESSHVEAWESSHVVARGSSHVVARGSSHVEARESSHVVAWESVAVHNHSEFSTLELFGFAAAWLIAKTLKITRNGENTSVIEPVRGKGTSGWLEDETIKDLSGVVILFKRVSVDFKTQEGEKNETLWALGSVLEHPSWSPEKQECGEGTYHACSHAYFCDEFRSKKDDRYIAIQVSTADLFVWENGQHPHKVAFRKGTVLHECDKYGKKV
jgi:hypothetical protein